LLANNGMLLVDDIGRQRVSPAEMINRFSAPLEHGSDQLLLPGGQAEPVPFDVTVVFATDLAPGAVFGPAFLRRIGYKVALGPLSEASYRALLRRQCRLAGTEPDEEAERRLLALHAQAGRPLLAGYVHELLGRIAEFASFADAAPRLSAASVEQAWDSMFATCAAAPSTSGDPS
jgi:hypothetical protein